MVEKFVERARAYVTSYTAVSRAHYLASAHYAKLNRWFGIPNIVCSTLAGTTILTKAAEADRFWLIIAGLLALSSAVLSALHNFLGFAGLSERHKTAGESYRNLKRRFETFIIYYEHAGPAKEEEAHAEYLLIQDKIEEMAKLYPTLADHYYDQAKREQQELATR
jgi:hypothetical protein